jgi:hypothetical protein
MTVEQHQRIVEGLKAENSKLREALDELLDLVSRQRDFDDDGDGMTVERAEKALAATQEKPE